MTKKNHTKLIYDISEISGLFSDARSLDEFLERIVVMVAAHMASPVCSIYLYDEPSRTLVLSATKGLKPEAVGKVSLRLGEGLTGKAVKELRPICRECASQSNEYKYFPEIGEESYESFLAVPLLRGQKRIGALVIQNFQKNFFSESDAHVLLAIASQLAHTIESTKTLIDLENKKEELSSLEEDEQLSFVKGRIGSPGVALAEAMVYSSAPDFSVYQRNYASQAHSLEDFFTALAKTEEGLLALQRKVEEKLADIASLIFTAQILMLKDQVFIEAIKNRIEQGQSVVAAVVRTVEEYIQMFDHLEDQYLKEKKEDVRDIGRLLLDNLVGKKDAVHRYQDMVVVARELLATDVLKLSTQDIRGIVLLSGGITSHVSILARSLQIPLVIVDCKPLLKIPDSTRILIDGEQGNIYVNPPQDVVQHFKQREKDHQRAQSLRDSIAQETFTKDGKQIRVLSNINLLNDAKSALLYKAEGVGLYRTEFPFLIRTNFPSEQEQVVIYKRLVEDMGTREITFRTLDIGGDKVLSYYDYEKEKNPFLGMRSIRFSLTHRDVFKAQLRAILRAGAGVDLRIMFPMISSMDEFLLARSITLDCVKELRKEKQPCHEHPQMGVMIEMPSVLEIINELAKEADFFSIGTNDFIQYMLAVDRTNEKVADLYAPHHPAILRALKRVTDAALAQGKKVCVCGDMAHQEKYLSFLIGLGIDRLSVDPQYIPQIKHCIQSMDSVRAAELASRLLAADKIWETLELIDG